MALSEADGSPEGFDLRVAKPVSVEKLLVVLESHARGLRDAMLRPPG